MKIFITGATGFIGQHLANILAREGNEVNALVRRKNVPDLIKHSNIHLHEGNLLDEGSIQKAIEGCEQVYHLAGYARAWNKDINTFYNVNVTGTKNILDAAKAASVKKVVAASTAGVFPPAKNGQPVDETAIKQTAIYTEYERTKNLGEELCRQYAANGLPVVIINPTKVFGPGPVDESNSATLMIRDYIRGKWKVIPGNGKGVMDYVYVDDVAEGFKKAMEKGDPGEQYILGGNNVSYDDFFGTVKRMENVKHAIFKIPVPVIMTIATLESAKAKLLGLKPLITPEWVKKIPYSWAKTSAKAKAELDYNARSFEQSVSDTINWLKATKQI